MEGALILARYGLEEGRGLGRLAGELGGLDRGGEPRIEGQRQLLLGLLASPRPELGMELLKETGFIETLWPELGRLDTVDQSKEFHPEGNVWSHTMETFRYRKPQGSPRAGEGAYDLRLSLGLLLHDLGKPLAGARGGRPFDGHAELGARAARSFLERLGFPSALIGDISYLVKHHMIPAALPRLPLARSGEIMASPLFPVLLELYRCDESSSFKGPEGYYRSSAAYRAYLKYARNPYRSVEGKKPARGRKRK